MVKITQNTATVLPAAFRHFSKRRSKHAFNSMHKSCKLKNNWSKCEILTPPSAKRYFPPDKHALFKDDFATGYGELSKGIADIRRPLLRCCKVKHVTWSYSCRFSELYVMRAFYFIFFAINLGPKQVRRRQWVRCLIRKFFPLDSKISLSTRSVLKIELACPHASDGIRIQYRETRPTRCAAIMVYCSVREWTRFYYVIGFENIRIRLPRVIEFIGWVWTEAVSER